MFPINTASKASLIEKVTLRAASRLEKTERAKKKTEGELTHGNKQITECYMY